MPSRRPQSQVPDVSRRLTSPSRPAPLPADLLDHIGDERNKMEFATYEARVASFAPPTKRAKGWPHKSPSPQDLARAGFFWKPTSSKDNVECFMCGRYLDGWEEDDNALAEHLKHGPDCAWAQLMTVDAESHHHMDDIEDPTGKSLTEARRNTFETLAWPHESKRGWTCKTEKMVEAGWHFAPTTECEDYTSCVYCKLSLDGWEPKDNPFDEHYRRSPDCPFFVFAGTTQPSKRSKKKGTRISRASKASRLSTQSTGTALSQPDESTGIIEILGHDTTMEESLQDNSMLSVQSTKSTATTKAKRKAPARTKAATTKKPKSTKDKKVDETLAPTSGSPIEQDTAQPVSDVQSALDDSVVEIVPPPKPKAKRGRKKQADPPPPAEDETRDTSSMSIDKVAPPKKTRPRKKHPEKQAEPSPEPTPAPEILAQPQSEPEAEPELGSENEHEPERELESVPEPESEQNVDADTEPTRDPLPQLESESESESISDRENLHHQPGHLSQEPMSMSPEQPRDHSTSRQSASRQARSSTPPSILSETDHRELQSEPFPDEEIAENDSDVEMHDDQQQPDYPTLPHHTPEDEFEDAAEMPGAFESAALQDHPESGPPEKEGTPIPFKQISPLKEQSNPPRPTLSPAVMHDQSVRRSSQRLSRQKSLLQRSSPHQYESDRSSSPPYSGSSDQENQPPTPVPATVSRTPAVSPAKMPLWDPIDVDALLQASESQKVDLFPDGINGDLSEGEKEMTVQEWFMHLAAQAEANLNAEGERIVSLFEREGQRALDLLQSIECS